MTWHALLQRLALPLAVHCTAAVALVARVQPSLELRPEMLGPMRHGVDGLVLVLALLPATVPSVLVALASPWARRTPAALQWWLAGLWLVATDTAVRAAVAWLLPPPATLGEIFQRVALAPDAIGRLLDAAWPAAGRALGAVAALGGVQLLAAICAGIAVAQGRHGPESEQPLPYREVRGMAAGVAGAVVVAVIVRVTSTPAASVWLSLLA